MEHKPVAPNDAGGAAAAAGEPRLSGADEETLLCADAHLEAGAQSPYDGTMVLRDLLELAHRLAHPPSPLPAPEPVAYEIRSENGGKRLAYSFSDVPEHFAVRPLVYASPPPPAAPEPHPFELLERAQRPTSADLMLTIIAQKSDEALPVLGSMAQGLGIGTEPKAASSPEPVTGITPEPRGLADCPATERRSPLHRERRMGGRSKASTGEA